MRKKIVFWTGALFLLMVLTLTGCGGSGSTSSSGGGTPSSDTGSVNGSAN